MQTRSAESLSVRVLHAIPSVAGVRGGTSRAVLDMVGALRAQGIDAEIVTTNDDGDRLLDVPIGVRSDYEGIPTYFFPRYSPAVPAVREFAFSSAFTTWLWQNIHNYDLIHVHALFSYPATAAMAIARIRSVPYVTTPHGLLCKWSLEQAASKKQVYLNLIERANLDRAQAIHLTCQQEREDLLLLDLKAPTFILPLGLTAFPTPIPDAATQLQAKLQCAPDEPIILFLSRLHYKKGLDYLIPALGKLTHHRFTLVIAGNGTPEYEAEIQTLIRTAGIEERTRLVGFVTGVEKDLFIQGASLFALTSHSENFGMAVLEALAVGTPVLVTPGVGLATVVKEQTLGYVPDLDLEAIVVALDRFLSDPAPAVAMGDRARKFIGENYNWAKIAKDLINAYQAII